jgi:putative ABC transport system substrate-binding protein
MAFGIGRRELITGLSSAALTLPVAARAQQPAMPVIGNLNMAAAQDPRLLVAIRLGLAEQGYVEGKNVTIEYRNANFKPELLGEAARDLIRLNVKVILALNPEALAAARSATTSIPVVGIDLESDPVAKGYAKSLARPGGNITGMFLDIPELSGKQLGLLKEIFPRLSHIAMFGVPGLNALQFAATETAAQGLAIEAETVEVQSSNDFEDAFETAITKHVEAGILLSSPLVYVSSKQIAELALANRLPLICLFGEFPKAGGFMAYGPNVAEMYRRLGGYVGTILNGAKPSDLPIQRPEKFDLAINLKTAKALGLDIPTQLQQLADVVIE